MANVNADLQPGEGPQVDFSLNSQNTSEPRKSVIGARKPQAKKSSVSGFFNLEQV